MTVEVDTENRRRQTSLLEILDKAGIKSKKQIKQLLATTRWSKFAETYFKAPPDLEGNRKILDDDKLILDKWQIKVIDKIQYIYYNRGLKGVKRYVLVVAPRSLGKSVVVGIINAILLIIGPNTTAIFSPSESQSENIMAKTKYFLQTSEFRKIILKRGETAAGMQKIYTGSLSVGTKKGSFSVGYANNETTMRGGHFSAVLIDEYARMSTHTVKAGIMPMVRRSKGPLIAITTPFGRFGPAWEAYENKDKNGRKGEGPWEVIRVSATEVDWITDESLEEEKAVYGDDEALARQELEAEFISDDNAVFKDHIFATLYREDYSNYHPHDRRFRYHMSIDIGWDSNRAVITVGHLEEKVNKYGDVEKFIKVDMIKSFVQPDPQMLQDEIVKWVMEYNVVFILPDGQSVGVETLKRLKRRFRKDRIRVKIYTSDSAGKVLGFITTGGSGIHSKTNLVSEGVIRASNHEIRIPSHTQSKGEESYELENEMRSFAYERSSMGANVKFGRGVNEEADDRILALLYLIFSFTIKVGMGSAYGASATREHPGDSRVYRGRSSIEDSGAMTSNREIRRGMKYVQEQRQRQGRNFGKY